MKKPFATINSACTWLSKNGFERVGTDVYSNGKVKARLEQVGISKCQIRTFN